MFGLERVELRHVLLEVHRTVPRDQDVELDAGGGELIGFGELLRAHRAGEAFANVSDAERAQLRQNGGGLEIPSPGVADIEAGVDAETVDEV